LNRIARNAAATAVVVWTAESDLFFVVGVEFDVGILFETRHVVVFETGANNASFHGLFVLKLPLLLPFLSRL